MPPEGAGWTAWGGAVMNAWNHDFVHGIYRDQLRGVLKYHGDGLVSVYPSSVVPRVRAALDSGLPLDDIEDHTYPWPMPDFGYVAMLLSEMGDIDLKGLLAYADRYMSPSWSDGGLYYPRNDESYDGEGHLVRMDRLTGNAMLAYARLNVPDGLWTMYNRPWTADHFARPSLQGLTPGIDVTRAIYDDEARLLVLTLQPRERRSPQVNLDIGPVKPDACWTLFVDGAPAATNRRGLIARKDAVQVTARQGALLVDLPLEKAATLVIEFDHD